MTMEVVIIDGGTASRFYTSIISYYNSLSGGQPWFTVQIFIFP